MLRPDVREIVKAVNGSLCLIADSKINAIGIPRQTERITEVEQILAGIKPLTVKTSKTWLQRFQYPVMFSGVMLMFTSFYVENKWVCTIAGLPCCALLIYSFIKYSTQQECREKG
jgi:hypothetical protein